jgi:membrane fusion protein (multidrug efflux system)
MKAVTGFARETLFGCAAAVLLAFGPVPGAVAQQVPRVVVAEAAMAGVGQTITYNGRAVAVQKVDLRARISGFVEARGFVEGGMVAAGDVLFELEDDAYQSALAQAEASIAQAQAAEQLALIERDRQAELVARGSAPQAQLDRAEADYNGRAAEVRRLMAARDQAQLNLSYAHIAAPFAGRVGLSQADVGALVGPESGPLLTVVAIDPMTVEFPVPERELLRFQAAVGAAQTEGIETITLTRADGSVYPENGTIDFAAVTVDEGTDTVLLRAVFANPEGQLRDGALVSVTLSAATPDLSLTVPQQAIQRDLTGAFVLVVDTAGTVEQRRVEVGRLSQGVAVIASGLTEGERVITEGANKVRPGMTVDAALAGQG